MDGGPMYSQRAARDIEALERYLGDSHECQRCGYRFLAHEDGCPTCGASNGYLAPIHQAVPELVEGEEVVLATLRVLPDGAYTFISPETSPPKQT